LQHITAKPCGGSNEHNPRSYAPNELNKQYQFYPTPSFPRGNNLRAAVALDCEMGTAVSGDSELIRVTLIDYFSGAILVNNIVEPDVPMRHLNTRFSGVSWAHIRKAKKERTCLRGKAEARRVLWRYIGPETVVVGHGTSNDLRALRWIHPFVVDSFVIEFGIMKKKENESEGVRRVAENREESSLPMSGNGFEEKRDETVAKKENTRRKAPGNLSLKSLVSKRLDRNIQSDEKTGHDSLEDAIAARDLVHWIVSNPNCRS
jgi:RNA exonuclease 1